jgi:hypothetical protein
MTYDLLKEAEAAAILNLSKSMLRKMRALGTGPDFVKIGASVLYPAGTLSAFIQFKQEQWSALEPAALEP